MISAIKPDFINPELFTVTETVVDYYLLDAVSAGNITSAVVLFADENLANEIRLALNIGMDEPITQAKLNALLTLTLVSADIVNLSGLQYAANLLQLNLPGNRVRDLSPLNGLNKLEQLLLDDNELTDLSSLPHLPSLKLLSLNYNNITDISPVNCLTTLQTLSADGNNIYDISALTALGDIQQFSIEDNIVDDISVIENYPKLQGIYLSGNPLSSLEPLRDRANLQVVVLNDIGISDFTELANCPHLERVEISNNNVCDISFIRQSKDYVVTFIAECNNISDLSALRNAKRLKTIDLYNNPTLSDISALEFAPELALLVIPSTGVTDLTHINRNITGLYVAHNDIADFSPLADLTNLLELNAVDTGIVDPGFINEHPFLSSVILDENHITDLRGLTQPLPLRFSVLAQSIIEEDIRVGENVNLALFKPDGSAANVIWLTPGTYQPAAKSVRWHNSGMNLLAWNETSDPAFEFSGTFAQYVVE